MGGRSISTGSFLTPNVPGTAPEHPIAIGVPILLEDEESPLLRGGSGVPRGSGPVGMKWVMECSRSALRNGPRHCPGDQRPARRSRNVHCRAEFGPSGIRATPMKSTALERIGISAESRWRMKGNSEGRGRRFLNDSSTPKRRLVQPSLLMAACDTLRTEPPISDGARPSRGAARSRLHSASPQRTLPSSSDCRQWLRAPISASPNEILSKVNKYNVQQ